MNLIHIHPDTGAHITAPDIARRAIDRAREELHGDRAWLGITADQLFDFLDAESDCRAIDEMVWRLACSMLVERRIADWRADNGSGEPGHYCERGRCCVQDRVVLDAMRVWLMPIREAAIAAE